MTSLRDKVVKAISHGRGVVFANPAIVHRGMYAGRGIIAPNSKFHPDFVDDRGYLPVEWWVMSSTEARNAVARRNEGVTSLVLDGEQVLLTEALQVAGSELMGGFSSSWPLTKVLDIGGEERRPVFSRSSANACAEETPPIPCHVHAGRVEQGKCVGQGKTEAYFFPPLDVPPYNLQLRGIKTRLGLKRDTTREQVLECLKQFGRNDDLYSLLSVYDVNPWETWTILEKTIHAPGPWPTFEIQRPQDDYHLLAWQLGVCLGGDELVRVKESENLRGLPSEQVLLEETLDWDRNVDADFKSRWWHKCEVLEEGAWGRRVRLFYDLFYGEGLVVCHGMSYQRPPDSRPYAGIIWSGHGTLNGSPLDCQKQLEREFLVTPNHAAVFQNNSQTDLIVFTVFPINH